jgi:hypothetical protein
VPIPAAPSPPVPRPPRLVRRRARSGIALAALLTLAAIAPPAHAQQQDSVLQEENRTPRAKSYAYLGIIFGGVAGLALGATQNPPAYSVTAAGALLGGVAGWLIGRQYDDLHRAQFRGVRPISPRSISIELDGEPVALATNDTIVAVGGTEGVQLFFSGASLLPTGARAAGIIGIATLDIAPHSEWLTLGSANGLYIFPPHRGRGVLVNESSVAAVVTTPGMIFWASGDRVSMTPVTADSTERWPGVSLGAPVRAIALDAERAVLWVVTDELLVALRITGDSLARIGAAPIDGGARRVAVLKNRVAVAVGTAGVRLYDVSDAAHPKAQRPWTVARFAYDVSLDGDRMFVAAGPEGVYVAEFRHGSTITIGLARGLGFASAIVSREGYTYLLDRRTNTLRRVETAF